ncbi:unnamed protein product [Nippostrongylus brasiliensis]|uniref:Aldo_ket_red domain-containing protein n=1 Tax=Nippostrongylus brasiliensis TaxID=27835 RepID=A0A0N4XND2_NIPBR|nr:unnamed protein product [Nippostrongylus brasiliensis]
MLLAHCKVPPALNQIELHPHFHQLDLLEYCKARDIAIQVGKFCIRTSMRLINDVSLASG